MAVMSAIFGRFDLQLCIVQCKQLKTALDKKFMNSMKIEKIMCGGNDKSCKYKAEI